MRNLTRVEEPEGWLVVQLISIWGNKGDGVDEQLVKLRDFGGGVTAVLCVTVEGFIGHSHNRWGLEGIDWFEANSTGWAFVQTPAVRKEEREAKCSGRWILADLFTLRSRLVQWWREGMRSFFLFPQKFALLMDICRRGSACLTHSGNRLSILLYRLGRASPSIRGMSERNNSDRHTQTLAGCDWVLKLIIYAEPNGIDMAGRTDGCKQPQLAASNSQDGSGRLGGVRGWAKPYWLSPLVCLIFFRPPPLTLMLFLALHQTSRW